MSTEVINTNKLSSKAYLGGRILLGLLFVVFGLNGFFQFLPMPKPTEQGMQFLGALMATGYMFPVIKIIEIAVGVLLLSNKFTSFALIILAPISVNILLYHLFLDINGLPMALFIVVAHLLLAWHNRETYKVLFK